MNVIETNCPGKGYGGTWALREGTLVVPAGHVATLVGPNGAGKTTLLNLAVGRAGPLYKSLSAADMLHLTRNLNWPFDHGYARVRLAGQTARASSRLRSRTRTLTCLTWPSQPAVPRSSFTQCARKGGSSERGADRHSPLVREE